MNNDICNLIYRAWIGWNNDNYLEAVQNDIFCTEWMPLIESVHTGRDYSNNDILSYLYLYELGELPEGELDIFSSEFCLVMIPYFDWNSDDHINFREFTTFITLMVFNPDKSAISQQWTGKPIGVNCSSCVGDTYDINMNVNITQLI